ncbi:hypothetical protein LXL04_037629 [Taraxacum kok-saghyz]
MHKHPVIFTTSDSIQNGNYKPLRYPFRPHSDPHLTTSRRPISFLHRHRLLLSQNPLRRRHSLVSYLHRLTATWPSITGDPRLHDIISTFPAVHRSFFQDSFPALVITTAAGVTHHTQSHHLSSHQYPSQIISAIDLRYQKDIVYSKSNFTDTTDAFLSSELRIRLNPESKPETINLKLVGEVDEATLMSHLQESMNLNWIVIDPTHKRAGNISSIKPVNVRRGWMNDDIHLLYAIVLPGSDENNKVVQCRIQVVMGVDTGSKGLKVKEVMMELIDMDFCLLKGREFLVILKGALLGENNVKRKMVDDVESLCRYREFKRMSINSLSYLQSEIKKDMVMVRPWPWHCFLQKLFRLCMMLVVVVLLIYSW